MKKQLPNPADLNLTKDQLRVLQAEIAKARRRRALPIYTDFERSMLAVLHAAFSNLQSERGRRAVLPRQSAVQDRQVRVARLFLKLPSELRNKPQSDATALAIKDRLNQEMCREVNIRTIKNDIKALKGRGELN